MAAVSSEQRRAERLAERAAAKGSNLREARRRYFEVEEDDARTSPGMSKLIPTLHSTHIRHEFDTRFDATST